MSLQQSAPLPSSEAGLPDALLCYADGPADDMAAEGSAANGTSTPPVAGADGNGGAAAAAGTSSAADCFRGRNVQETMRAVSAALDAVQVRAAQLRCMDLRNLELTAHLQATTVITMPLSGIHRLTRRPVSEASAATHTPKLAASPFHVQVAMPLFLFITSRRPTPPGATGSSRPQAACPPAWTACAACWG